MSFETTVNLGNILTIVSFIVGGLYFMLSVRAQGTVLEHRFTGVEAELEDAKLEMKKLNDILVRMAMADVRLNHVEQRQLAQGARLDETIGRLNQLVDRITIERESRTPAS